MAASSTNGSVDGVTEAPSPAPRGAAPMQPEKPTAAMQSTKALVILGFGLFSVIYVLVCLGFLAVLPSTDQATQSLVPIALGISAVGGIIFLGTGLLLFQRITRSDASIQARQWSLIKAVAAVVPGLLVSIVTPIMVMREPSLPIDITDPTTAEDLVAPVPVTFSAERALKILQALNLKPLQYQWDTNGDGKVDDQSVVPTTTAVFARQGVYTVTLVINLEGGQQRKLVKRFTIPQAVFSVTPIRPIVERAVRFSIADLLTDPKLLKQVVWSFSADPGDQQTVTVPDIAHTYYSTGRIPVSATVTLTNNTQLVYKRTITVEDQPPLPFEVSLISEPKQLLGPAPFGAIFHVETKEPIKEYQWSFGDPKDDQRGSDLSRVAKSFDQPGIYPVTVSVRSTSGKLAELTTIVRVTEQLQISDLTFEGQANMQGLTVRGTAPLAVSLTPKTALPLIQFSWEDPDGDSAIQGSTISKVYRAPGNYTLTLIGQNPEGKVYRQNVTVQVDPPSTQPVIAMKPEGGSAPLSVVFDASQTYIPPGQQIAGFEWLFGDEGPQTNPVLGAAHIEHIYKTAGEFAVTLRVVMSDGKDYKVQRTLVVRRPNLSACITASRTTVQAGKGVEFDSSCSIGTISQLQWDVRSSSNPSASLAQSSESRYVHVFDTAGSYVVTLTITDDAGNNDSQTSTITVTP